MSAGHSSLFDRIVLARIVVACMIVLPPVWFYQRSVANEQATKLNTERSQRNEQTTKLLLVNDGKLAQERIDRVIAACNAYNEQRIDNIATSEAIIRLAVSNEPGSLTQRDQLLLAAFVQKANRAIESVTKPKKCTVAALQLQPLEGIVKASKGVVLESPSAEGVRLVPSPTKPNSFTPTTVRRSPPRSTPRTTPTTERPSPPTTVKAACAKQHGRCPPK